MKAARFSTNIQEDLQRGFSWNGGLQPAENVAWQTGLDPADYDTSEALATALIDAGAARDSGTGLWGFPLAGLCCHRCESLSEAEARWQADASGEWFAEGVVTLGKVEIIAESERIPGLYILECEDVTSE